MEHVIQSEEPKEEEIRHQAPHLEEVSSKQSRECPLGTTMKEVFVEAKTALHAVVAAWWHSLLRLALPLETLMAH